MARGRWLLFGALLVPSISAGILPRAPIADAVTGAGGAPAIEARGGLPLSGDMQSVAPRALVGSKKEKLIIDTDPGVDDVLAMLLAMAVGTEKFHLALLSVTYGNVELESCMKNVIALFKVLGLEKKWREKTNQKIKGFDILNDADELRPVVAKGAEHSIVEKTLAADYFHGKDGLHGVHAKFPDMSPANSWQSLVKGKPGSEDGSYHEFFKTSSQPAHKEILKVLKESDEGTVTICAIGPLTNLAMAAAEDPETFLRVKEVVVMGGGIASHQGNVQPRSEFNAYADPVSFARVLALTSKKPSSSMPARKGNLKDYPKNLSKQLNLALAPLDLTNQHEMKREEFENGISKPLEEGSPLAKWLNHIMDQTFKTVEEQFPDSENPGLSLHDPVTVWYAMTRDQPGWETKIKDIRVETAPGSMFLGAIMTDERIGKKKISTPIENDIFNFLKIGEGNEVKEITRSPGAADFNKYLLTSLFPN